MGKLDIKQISKIFVVQLLSHVQLFATLWTAARQASLSFNISQSLLKLMSFESMMPSNLLSSIIPFSSCLQTFPASGSWEHLGFREVMKSMELNKGGQLKYSFLPTMFSFVQYSFVQFQSSKVAGVR